MQASTALPQGQFTWKLTGLSGPGGFRESLPSYRGQKKSCQSSSGFHKTCQNHLFILGQLPINSLHIVPTDISQGDTAWRIIVRIKVHFWVLWWYPRFAVSLCNANGSRVLLSGGSEESLFCFPHRTPLWLCRRVPWANCTTVQTFPALWLEQVEE